jgi:hypothetical protein
VFFTNQWLYDNEGTWTELTNAVFTGDVIAKKRYRIDFNSDVEKNAFFLQNGGFLNSKITKRPLSIIPIFDVFFCQKCHLY